MSKKKFEAFCKQVEDQCFFAKIRILDRWVASLFEKSFKEIGLTPYQFNLLVSIQTMGEFASAKNISHFLKMDKSTVSRDLKKLTDLGFLNEQTDQLDQRKKSLSLTPSGKNAVNLCQQAWNQAQENVEKMFLENGISISAAPSRNQGLPSS